MKQLAEDIIEKLQMLGYGNKAPEDADAIAARVNKHLFQLCAGDYLLFTRSESNYENRVWHQVACGFPGSRNTTMTASFKTPIAPRIGVSVSHRPLAFAGEEFQAAKARIAMQRNIRHFGTHYAHLVAFCALEVGKLDEHADIVIATSSVPAATALVEAGAVLLYDDTREVSSSTGIIPVFPANVMEALDVTADGYTGTSADRVPIAKWKGPLRDDDRKAWNTLLRNAAVAQMKKNLASKLFDSLMSQMARNPRPPLGAISNSLSVNLARLVSVLSFDRITLMESEEMPKAPWKTYPQHTAVEISVDEDYARKIDETYEKCSAIVRIWDELLERNQLSVKFSENPEEWSRLITTGKALGIDAAVDAYLSGSPLEHVIAD